MISVCETYLAQLLLDWLLRCLVVYVHLRCVDFRVTKIASISKRRASCHFEFNYYCAINKKVVAACIIK